MKLLRKLVLAAAVITAFANVANAQSLSDLLGKIKGNSGSGSDSGSTIGNILNGVAGALTGSDLKVKDLEGNWQASGPAVSFKGDNTSHSELKWWNRKFLFQRNACKFFVNAYKWLKALS